MEKALIVLQGLPILIFSHDAIGISFYYLRGVPFLWIVILISVKWVLGMLLIFYATSWLVKNIRKFLFVEKIEARHRKLFKIFPPKKDKENKTLNWILKRKNGMVIFLSFVPYSNLLGIATIVAVRTLKIKYGIFILLVATVFKALVFCFTFQYFFQSF